MPEQGVTLILILGGGGGGVSGVRAGLGFRGLQLTEWSKVIGLERGHLEQGHLGFRGLELAGWSKVSGSGGSAARVLGDIGSDWVRVQVLSEPRARMRWGP